MSNPYEVSVAIATALLNKIEGGTATPEEVALYTKGMQLLESGGDFQSIPSTRS